MIFVDEETKAMFEEIMSNVNDLNETVETIKEEKDSLIDMSKEVRNAAKVDAEEESKKKEEKNKILAERTENLIIAIDQLLDYIQEELENSMMSMPIGIVRMILNFALGSVPKILEKIPFDPKEICDLGSKIGTKPESKAKKLCSVADLVGKVIS